MPLKRNLIIDILKAMRLDTNWIVYASVLVATLIIAATFPITNDESYYIAFAKNLQLSYVDAPPFVSYLNIIQMKLGLMSPLYQRSLVLMLHLVSTLFLLLIVRNHCANETDLSTKLLITFLMAYIVPIFGLFGIFILPDCGLILSLSILLWVADKIVSTTVLSWTSAFILGVALGIGLLSKYHILPLGGGILLGILLELSLRSKFSWYNLIKLIMSVFIALICAIPLFVWNYEHHFASFVFQFQHGFSSNSWRLTTMLAFLLCSIIYLTPAFTFVLLKRGLLVKKYLYLWIPVCSLFIILLVSSLRKSVLPHWISPAFWLLIPYCVIYSGSHLKLLMRLCKYTALIWVVLVGVLLIPGGLMNIKELSKLFNPDTKVFKDLLLWEELSELMKKEPTLEQTITTALHQKPSPDCSVNKPIIGTFRWFWASQVEYHNMFPGAQVLNLDQHSSNYYLWRDNWSDYANCNVLLIGGEDKYITTALAKIMTINNEFTVHGLGDYRSLNLQVINGTLKDRSTLQQVQNMLASHPHY